MGDYFSYGGGAYGDNTGWGSGGSSRGAFKRSGQSGQIAALKNIEVKMIAATDETKSLVIEWKAAAESQEATLDGLVASVRQLFNDDLINISVEHFYKLVEENKRRLSNGEEMDDISSPLV